MTNQNRQAKFGHFPDGSLDVDDEMQRYTDDELYGDDE